MGHAANVGAPHNRAGKQIEPGPHPIAFADRVLLQILPLYQRGNLPKDRGGRKIQAFDQSLQRPLSVTIHKAFQNLQSPQNAGNLFFCHIFSTFRTEFHLEFCLLYA
ncbi:hypothetical protein SDC9_86845 [bioreactor metagenome]|uniref:Uncharacterized protein n=1 Tax=bioreactor metagenome TaxID=1076179 RepID=A0A644ZH35_9ZZZZ